MKRCIKKVKFQVRALHQGEKGACGLSVYMYTGDGGAVPVWLKSGDLDVIYQTRGRVFHQISKH